MNEIDLKDYIHELGKDITKGIKDEKKFRKQVPRSDQAYINQLHTDSDIFNGLFPELEKEMKK